MNAREFLTTFPLALHGVLQTWLHTGWVADHSAMGAESASPPRYRTIGQFVSTHSTLQDGWERQTVSEFLSTPTAHGTVRLALRSWLPQIFDWLRDTALETNESLTWQERQELREQTKALLQGSHGEELADSLMATLQQEIGHLTLWDLFRRRRHQVGFASWAPESAGMLEEAKPVRRGASADAAPHVLYLECSDYFDGDGPIGAYEWAAGTRSAEEGQWRAVAAGMLYRFRGKRRTGRAELLMEAADDVSTGDAERAEAFIKAYPDHDQILGKGDILVVWQWERREGTGAGEGADCMTAICAELRRQHPNLASIVFSISPERFMPRADNEPALVADGRLADIDRLHDYVSRVGTRLGLDTYITASDQSDVSRDMEVADRGLR